MQQAESELFIFTINMNGIRLNTLANFVQVLCESLPAHTRLRIHIWPDRNENPTHWWMRAKERPCWAQVSGESGWERKVGPAIRRSVDYEALPQAGKRKGVRNALRLSASQLVFSARREDSEKTSTDRSVNQLSEFNCYVQSENLTTRKYRSHETRLCRLRHSQSEFMDSTRAAERDDQSKIEFTSAINVKIALHRRDLFTFPLISLSFSEFCASGSYPLD